MMKCDLAVTKKKSEKVSSVAFCLRLPLLKSSDVGVSEDAIENFISARVGCMISC